MTTIRELHERAGNPELSHWRTRRFYSLMDAAMLTCGIEPLLYAGRSESDVIDNLKGGRPVNWEWALMISRSLAEQICMGLIKSQYILVLEYYNNGQNCWETQKEQTSLSLSDSPHIYVTQTLINRDEHLKYLRSEGFLDVKTNLQPIRQSENQPVEVLALPSPQYSTPYMDCLQEVVKEFWYDYDPESGKPPPKKETVLEWLKENGHRWQLDSGRISSAIDTITRHPIALKGGVKPLRVTPKK